MSTFTEIRCAMEINWDLLSILFFMGLIGFSLFSRKGKPSPASSESPSPDNSESPSPYQEENTPVPSGPDPYSTSPIPGMTLGDLLEEMLNPGKNTARTGPSPEPAPVYMGPDSSETILPEPQSIESGSLESAAMTRKDYYVPIQVNKEDLEFFNSGEEIGDPCEPEPDAPFPLKEAVIHSELLQRKYF